MSRPPSRPFPTCRTYRLPRTGKRHSETVNEQLTRNNPLLLITQPECQAAPRVIRGGSAIAREAAMSMRANEVGDWLRQIAGKRDHHEALSGDYVVIRPGPN